jgi:uncharacterized protein with HEPN domain
MTCKVMRVPDYLMHILDAIARIKRYTHGKTHQDFVNDEQLQDAVVRNIEIIGEAARNIERCAPEFAAEHDGIPWAALYAMRNRVAHGYWTVDEDAVWQVVYRDVPVLEEKLRLLIPTGPAKEPAPPR